MTALKLIILSTIPHRTNWLKEDMLIVTKEEHKTTTEKQKKFTPSIDIVRFPFLFIIWWSEIQLQYNDFKGRAITVAIKTPTTPNLLTSIIEPIKLIYNGLIN